MDSPATLNEPIHAASANASVLRKYILLLLFCVSQFLDAFNISALISAIPVMTAQLGLNDSESVWLVSAYQLTFAAFLLVSGRISDVYNAKYTFITGAFLLGILCLGAGFADNKIGLLVLRAVCGIAAALTIPSSLTLIVRLFPEEREQARAIGIYGGCAALGNVLGLIIGAIFIEFANWSWVFWLGALLACPIAAICIFLIPAQPMGTMEQRKVSNLDPLGIVVFTSALILLIFALTEAGNGGWARAIVLAPLIISICLIAGFFTWEARIDPDKAAFPPRMWYYPHFAILFAVALSVFFWFTTVFIQKVSLWQDVYGWTPLNCAIHFLPIGVIAGPIMLFSAPLTARFEKKYVILFSQMFIIISTIILPFAGSESTYWSRDFPALVIGAIGGSLLFVNANVAIFHNTPSEVAGTVGAIFNSALQCGSAVGLAIVTSIQTSVDANGGPNPYAGRAAGFWFSLAVVGVEALAVALLYRTSTKRTEEVKDLEKTPDLDADTSRDEKKAADLEFDGATTACNSKRCSALPKVGELSDEESGPDMVETAVPSPSGATTPLPPTEEEV